MNAPRARATDQWGEPAGGDIGPEMLLVTAGTGRVEAWQSPIYSLTRHEDEQGRNFVALTIAREDGMALYFEHDAASLRDLAAACLAGADRLDGGKGKQ